MRADFSVYRAAVHRLLSDLRVLQHAHGVKLLCPARLKAFKASVSYLLSDSGPSPSCTSWCEKHGVGACESADCWGCGSCWV